ncbi:hypothetical protein AGABI1DRAFT_112504 [Agaricus bisporus var. burnettii JB137-S8]|nr:uncharacterized protein AGABI1DRAFT_112504 [Agaricus bisporus var. burnettii JB137-S8]EKM80769.1 hypothetical protein AGABI1DRAFT_112504 [Agaricus bisporus var. burnettii JB137-S8]
MSHTHSRIWVAISAMLGQLPAAFNVAPIVLLLMFNTVACAMPTPGRRDAASDDDIENPNGSKQFLVVGAATGSVIALAIVVALVRWWRRKRAEEKVKGQKAEDRMPLSASFQPGELPALPYWPEQKNAKSEGIA